MNPPVKPFDPFAQNYNHVHDRYLPPNISHEQFFLQKKNWVLQQIAGLTQQQSGFKLLDFGCNHGELNRAIYPLHPHADYFGIDESLESLTTAQQQSPEGMTYLQKAEHLPTGLTFDLVTLFNVMHHIEPINRKGTLQQIKSLMKPKGTLLIWEHNRWNPLTRFLVKICPFDVGVKLVSKTWLQTALMQAGFEVIASEYINIFPPKLHRWKIIRSIENYLSSIPLGAQYRIQATAKMEN